jgi:hypothetical protein
MIDVWDLLGLTGVLVMNVSYIKVQLRRDYAKTLSFSLLNFIGAALLILSLLNKWNVAAVASNAIWAATSVYGIYRCLKYKHKTVKS